MDGVTASMPEGVLRISLLGGFRVSIGAYEVDDRAWRLRKARSLVKLLALAPAHCLHRERVIDHLWPELDLESGANVLHRTLHAARRTLEPARPPGARATFLTFQAGELALAPSDRLWTDVDAFRQAGATARLAPGAAAYQRAIALYTGDLLPNDLYEDWAATSREELRGLYTGLLDEAARYFSAHGAPEDAMEALRLLTRAEPTREDAHAGLMRLYALAGKRYEALRQYQQLRAILRRELDVEPEGATQRLYEAIQQGRLLPPLTRRIAPLAEASDATAAQAGPERPQGAHPREARPREPVEASLSHSPSPGNEADGTARPTRAASLPTYTTSFIGRAREREMARRMLKRSRLVTIVGPGGCGKTRLATQVADDLRSTLNGAVRFMELAALSDPSLMTQALALALGARESAGRPLIQAITTALESVRLLILDNCEHVREACAALVRDLLEACPELTILATSRQPLGVARESVWRLQTLAAPDPQDLPSFDALLAYDALALFVERASASRRGFALTHQNAAALVSICHRLDGIPLAIELAASRCGMLSVEQILSRLDDALAFLGAAAGSAPRHATLRAAIDWTWDLLDDAGRILFRRLAVFSGGMTLDAVEDICASAGLDGLDRRAILDLLTGLVERSLVTVEERDGLARYYLLETIRQYAAERLQGAAEEGELRRQHAAWYLALAEQSEEGLLGAAQARWLHRLESETGNLRAALTWACETGETELGLRLAASVAHYWYIRSSFNEGQEWLARMVEVDAARGYPAPLAVRAKAILQMGMLAMVQTNLPVAESAGEESVRLFRELNDPLQLSVAFSVLAGAAEFHGAYERALALNEESLAFARLSGDLGRITVALSNLADQFIHLGNLPEGDRYYRESLAAARRNGHRNHIAMALTNVGKTMALLAGDDAVAMREAEALLEEGLAAMRELGNWRGAAEALAPLGKLARAQGNLTLAYARYAEALDFYHRTDVKLGSAQMVERLASVLADWREGVMAARAQGAADALRARLSFQRSPAEATQRKRDNAALASLLGGEALAAARAIGRSLPIEQVIAELLARQEALAASASHAPPPEVDSRMPVPARVTLTARERQIAQLIAEGLTNREIAALLQITRRTADTHVTNILAKLKLRSRNEVGAWLRSEQDAH